MAHPLCHFLDYVAEKKYVRYDRNICVCRYFFVILQRVCLLFKFVKRIIILLLVILSLYCVDTMAYTRLNPDVHHFVSFDGSVAYSSLLNSSDSLKSGMGVSPYLGVGYRLFYNNFLFATGVEAQYMYNAYSTVDSKMTLNMLDTEGDRFTLYVDATKGDDRVWAVHMNLPLLLGMEYRRFYFLVGPKLSLNVWNQVQARGTIVTSASYDKYIDVFEQMPNHMLDSYDFQGDNYRVDWDMDVIAHVEIGARLGSVSFETGADIPKPKQRFYIAVFADYGLLNLSRSASHYSRIDYEQPSGQPLRIFLTPALMSKEYGGVRINQLSVGVKATVLLELPKRRPCVMCEEIIDVLY